MTEVDAGSSPSPSIPPGAGWLVMRRLVKLDQLIQNAESIEEFRSEARYLLNEAVSDLALHLAPDFEDHMRACGLTPTAPSQVGGRS